MLPREMYWSSNRGAVVQRLQKGVAIFVSLDPFAAQPKSFHRAFFPIDAENLFKLSLIFFNLQNILLPSKPAIGATSVKPNTRLASFTKKTNVIFAKLFWSTIEGNLILR